MLTEITLPAMEFLALNMREVDRIEVFGLRNHDSPVQFAWEAAQVIRDHGRGRIAWHDDRPAACVAFIEHRRGVWDIALFGSDAFKAVAVSCLRWIRETAPELRDEFGGVRLQCDSHIQHTEAHRFLRALGARRESVMPRYGKCGSTYYRFVWLADEDAPLLRKRTPRRCTQTIDLETLLETA